MKVRRFFIFFFCTLFGCLFFSVSGKCADVEIKTEAELRSQLTRKFTTSGNKVIRLILKNDIGIHDGKLSIAPTFKSGTSGTVTYHFQSDSSTRRLLYKTVDTANNPLISIDTAFVTVSFNGVNLSGNANYTNTATLLVVNAPVEVNITNSRLYENTCPSDFADTTFLLDKHKMSGGAILISDSSATLNLNSGTVIEKNSTGHAGGAIRNFGTIYLRGNAVIRNNRSFCKGDSSPGGRGGNIFNAGTICIQDTATVADGTAEEYRSEESCGGNIYTCNGGRVLQFGGTISGGSATLGGGVYVTQNGDFAQAGGTIQGNTSSGNGTAIYCNNGSVCTLNGGKIVDHNTDTTLINIKNSRFVVNGTNISGNLAVSALLRIHSTTDSSQFFMNGGTISGNRYGITDREQCVKVVSDGSESFCQLNGGTLSFGNAGTGCDLVLISNGSGSSCEINSGVKLSSHCGADSSWIRNDGYLVMERQQTDGNSLAERFLINRGEAKIKGTNGYSLQGCIQNEGELTLQDVKVDAPNSIRAINGWKLPLYNDGGSAVLENTELGSAASEYAVVNYGNVYAYDTSFLGKTGVYTGSGLIRFSGCSIGKESIQTSYGMVNDNSTISFNSSKCYSTYRAIKNEKSGVVEVNGGLVTGCVITDGTFYHKGGFITGNVAGPLITVKHGAFYGKGGSVKNEMSGKPGLSVEENGMVEIMNDYEFEGSVQLYKKTASTENLKIKGSPKLILSLDDPYGFTINGRINQEGVRVIPLTNQSEDFYRNRKIAVVSYTSDATVINKILNKGIFVEKVSEENGLNWYLKTKRSGTENRVYLALNRSFIIEYSKNVYTRIDNSNMHWDTEMSSQWFAG